MSTARNFSVKRGRPSRLFFAQGWIVRDSEDQNVKGSYADDHEEQAWRFAQILATRHGCEALRINTQGVIFERVSFMNESQDTMVAAVAEISDTLESQSHPEETIEKVISPPR